MNQAYEYSIGALIRPYPALVVTAATGGTPITTGRVVDRNLVGYARSSILLVAGSYTVATAAAGDLLTVSGTISHSASVSSGALVSPVSLKTFSVAVPWVSNAAGREFSISIASGLAAANEYIQLSSITLTPTSSGGTYSALSVRAEWVFAGEFVNPDPLYNPAGFLSFGT